MRFEAFFDSVIFTDNCAPLRPDATTAPLSLRVQPAASLSGLAALCNASVDVGTGPLQVPSGCGLALRVEALDAYGLPTTAPSTAPAVVSLGAACPDATACVGGFTQEVMTLGSAWVNVTVAGGVGSPLCIALQLRAAMLPAPVLAPPLLGVVADCAPGAVSPANGTCDTCRVCPEGVSSVSFQLSSCWIC
jgi:hypothetical protein